MVAVAQAVWTADAAMAPVAKVPDEAVRPLCGGPELWRALRVAVTAGLVERQAMAAAFAAMPAKVLWRLSPSEVPDEAAIAKLGIGHNTKVLLSLIPLRCRHDKLPV